MCVSYYIWCLQISIYRYFQSVVGENIPLCTFIEPNEIFFNNIAAFRLIKILIMKNNCGNSTPVLNLKEMQITKRIIYQLIKYLITWIVINAATTISHRTGIKKYRNYEQLFCPSSFFICCDGFENPPTSCTRRSMLLSYNLHTNNIYPYICKSSTFKYTCITNRFEEKTFRCFDCC